MTTYFSGMPDACPLVPTLSLLKLVMSFNLMNKNKKLKIIFFKSFTRSYARKTE